MVNPHLERMLVAAEKIPIPDLMTILALIAAHAIYANVDSENRLRALKMYQMTIKDLLNKFENESQILKH